VGEALVEGGEGCVEGLGQGDVPGVVGREVVAQRPDAFGERFVGEQLDREIGEVVVRRGGRVTGDGAEPSGRMRFASRFFGTADSRRFR